MERAQQKLQREREGEAARETELAGLQREVEEAMKGVVQKGRIEVNGPLPADFSERFARAVAQATGCDPTEVKVVETNPVVALLQGKAASGDVVEVVFEAPADVVKAVEDQAADPDSKLAQGALREFLVAKDTKSWFFVGVMIANISITSVSFM